MGAIVTLDEVKAAAGVMDNTQDAKLTQAIEIAEAEFQGAIRQMLLDRPYVDHIIGPNRTYVQLRYYPLISVQSVEIEGFDPVDVEDPDVIRFLLDTANLPILSFVNGQIFPRSYWKEVPNVTVSYHAGYADQPAVKAAMPDAWASVLAHSRMVHKASETKSMRQLSESFMGQSITLIEDGDDDELRIWRSMCRKYERLPVTNIVHKRR